MRVIECTHMKPVSEGGLGLDEVLNFVGVEH